MKYLTQDESLGQLEEREHRHHVGEDQAAGLSRIVAREHRTPECEADNLL